MESCKKLLRNSKKKYKIQQEVAIYWGEYIKSNKNIKPIQPTNQMKKQRISCSETPNF